MKLFKKIKEWYLRFRIWMLKRKIKSVKKQFNFIGSKLKPHKNSKLFGINKSGEVYEVHVSKGKIAFVNEYDKYLWALNLENAKRKLSA